MDDDSIHNRLRTAGALRALEDLGLTPDSEGQRLGEYRVGQLLGEGGMARVYRAQRADGQFEKDVAIKIVLYAAKDDRLQELIRRERQILADLNHPGIAQLYDSGITPEGLPYMVMELVEGSPADQYCHDNDLALAARVTLGVQIAEAVGHAHGQLVVHRDIKPSNVLITAGGQPKLLDFGIAKLLEADDEGATRTQAMTPGSASPEQMLGQPISVRSDVYQLGLLLLRMLVQDPLNSESWSEAVVRVSDGGALPVKRDAVAALPADLWLVIEKCLHQDPQQRYGDVTALINDLRRYLEGFPVTARRPSFAYVARRFLRRNALPVATSAIAGVWVIGATLWYLIEVTTAREVAEKRAETASRVTRTLTAFINDTFTRLIQESAAVNADGPHRFIRSSLANTAKVLESELAEEPDARAQALSVQGALERLLGDLQSAERSFLQAVDLIDPSDNPQLLLQTQLDLVHLYSKLNDLETAREVLDAAQQHAQGFSLTDVDALNLLVAQGATTAMAGDFTAANPFYTQAEALLENSTAIGVLPRLRVYSTLAGHYSVQSDFEKSLQWSERAIALAEEALAPDSYELIQPLQAAGWAHRMARQYEQALAHQRRALALAVANFGPHHPEVADLHNAMGAIRYSLNEMDAAAEHFRASLDISRRQHGENHLNVAGNHSNLGLVLLYGGRVAEAQEEYRQSIHIARELGSQGDRALAAVLRNMAYLHELMGEWEAAEQTYLEAIVVRERVFGENSTPVLEAMLYFAEYLASQGQVQRAEEIYDRAISVMREASPADDPGLVSWTRMGWKLVLARGDAEAARSMLREKIEASGAHIEYRSIFSTFELTELARLCLQLNDLTCAAQALEQGQAGVQVAPEHPHALYHAAVTAQLLARQGNAGEAQQLKAQTRKRILEYYPLRDDLLSLVAS